MYSLSKYATMQTSR